MSQVRIAGACLNQTPIDWSNNLSNIKKAIAEAKENHVQILCLPELSITSYGCQDLFLNNWLLEEALEKLFELLPLCSGITLAVGLPVSHKGHTYNTTCVIRDTKILGFYAKQILANDGIHYETRWFTPWPSGEVDQFQTKQGSYPLGDLTFDIEGIKVGFEICEDAWNKDRPACRLYEKGVQLILNPSASHFSFQKYKTRQELVISSSKKFDCHYLYVNQLGNESGRVIYDGDIILAGHGQLLLSNERFSYQPYNLRFYDIDLSMADYRSTIKKEDIPTNQEFAHAASLGLFDYLRKSGTKGYSLSLSGGADSSSIAILVALFVKMGLDQLGLETFCDALRLKSIDSNKPVQDQLVRQLLITAYQGTQNSSEETLNSAKNLAKSIGATFYSWNIDQIVKNNHDIVEQALGRKLEWEKDDIAMQNIQARSRSPLIWMIANITETILLTTSNRSEGAVGYTTMDGDTSGSLAPIAGVDKPFLLQWLKYAAETLGYKGLSYVNKLTPTAELRPLSNTQTDEDDLMPYDILLAIEKLAIFKRKSPVEVFLALKKHLDISENKLKTHITKFYNLWSINQWKRERLAPSFHLDDFNVDPKTWCRFPILSGRFKEELLALDKL